MRLVQLAELLKAELRGDAPELEVSSVASVKGAAADSVVFVEEEALLADALASPAAAVIVAEKLAHAVDGSKPALVTRHAKLAFARAARLLRSAAAHTGVHPTAIIDGTALLGRRVSVGAQAVVEAGVRIGEDSVIGAGVVLGHGAVVGRECHLYPRVVLYPGVELGDQVIVHAGAVLGADGFGYVRDEASGEYEQFPQQGRLVIEDRVEIGANSTIDRGALDETRIAAGVKIDNLVHIGHNVQVGKDVVIAAQTGISGSSVIGDHAIVGGQVGIGDHASIGEKVILGSGSGILSRKKVRGPGVVFWGTPAKPLRDYLKELAALSQLTRASEKKKKRKKE